MQDMNLLVWITLQNLTMNLQLQCVRKSFTAIFKVTALMPEPIFTPAAKAEVGEHG